MKPHVSVVIPAYNEADHIGKTLFALINTGMADEVILVDDGSRDDTACVGRQFGVDVIQLTRNRGKGHALNQGVDRARGKIVVLLDADLGETAAEAVRLVEPVMAGELDMAIGVFPKRRTPSGFGIAVGTARYGVRLLTGTSLEAPLSGQRAARREVLAACMPRGGPEYRFGFEVALTVDAILQGFRVGEVPVQMSHRFTGRDARGFIHRGLQLRDVMGVLLKRTLRARRDGAWGA